ncbi:unnamed protein product [Aphanomyces euteiches]
MPEATTVQSVSQPTVGPPAKKARVRAPPKAAAAKAAPTLPPAKITVPAGNAKATTNTPETATPKGKRPPPTATAAAAAATAAAKKKQVQQQQQHAAQMSQMSMNGGAPQSSAATPNMNNQTTTPGNFGPNGNPSMNSNNTAGFPGGLQRTYSGMNMMGAAPNGTPGNGANGMSSATPPSTDPSAVPTLDPTMRRTAMQALYMRYKQLHGTKVDDTTLQRMAAKLEQQIAMKSSSREEYTINSQNEIKRIDLSQRMYGTPPQGSSSQPGDNPMGNMAKPNPSANSTPTSNASMGNFNVAQQQQMLQRQLSQNMLYGGGNDPAAAAAAMQQAAQMNGNPFQHAAAPGNLSYQEFCQRMRFQPMEKLIDVMWNQRLMIFQLQQENCAYKKQCGALQQMVMTMNMNMNNGGYNNMQPQQPQYPQQFNGMKAQSPMFNSAAVNYGMQQPGMDQGQLSRQASMNNMTPTGNFQQPQTPQPSFTSQLTGPPPSSATPTAVPPSASSAPTATPTPSNPAAAPANAAAYWAKVQELKEKHSDHLKKAYQILCMAAQSGSRQTSKAESMKQNIHYAIVVLNESPATAQPRENNVLQAIETFIVDSIVPLVRKVQEVSQSQQMAAAAANSASATKSEAPGQHQPPQSQAQQHQQQQQQQFLQQQQQQQPMGEFTKQLFDATAPTHNSQPPKPQQTAAGAAAGNAARSAPPPPPATETKDQEVEKKENQSALGNMDDFDDFDDLDDLDDDKLDDDVDGVNPSSSVSATDSKRPAGQL